MKIQPILIMVAASVAAGLILDFMRNKKEN
jgi:hypothetical protein